MEQNNGETDIGWSEAEGLQAGTQGEFWKELELRAITEAGCLLLQVVTSCHYWCLPSIRM